MLSQRYLAIMRSVTRPRSARRPALALVLALVPPLALPADARNCTTLELDFAPGAHAANPFAPQIVAWVERPDGTYLDTVFITEQTGTYGMGNRPGRFDFNSGPAWPYGRRTTTFPIWSRRHGLSWDLVVFQDANDSNLSHPFNQSSRDLRYCRPLKSTEPQWDAMSCASEAYTDKGVLSAAAGQSFYPPRADVARGTPDDPSVDLYDMLNPFDAVSQATPPTGTLATITWPVPEGMTAGDYVLMVEVSREFDFNAAYSAAMYPGPTGIPFDDYGEPYRGQPSVVYRVPFTLLADGESSATTSDYAGYADPDGLDGNVRAPDNTITVDVPGSGAARLQLVSDNGSTYRVRVTAKPQIDAIAPAPAADVQLVDATGTVARIGFVAPGDDASTGRAKRYEIRYAFGRELDAASFDAAVLVGTVVKPVDGGAFQEFTIEGLLPETEYTVGIRAEDDCRNVGELATLTFETAPRGVGEVDACFVATAAYGSVLAADVDMLRRFRDAMLRKTAFGELAVETYYTFSPALAGLVGESDLLRATARSYLEPVVERVKHLKVSR